MAKVGPLSGHTLGGKYKLGDLLGEGGFGAVYRAENLLLKRQQAIKVLLPEHLNDPWVRNRFISEAEAQAKLDHPNIISIQDFGVEGGKHPYLVMPYINGGTLEAVISKRQKPLALDEIINYLEPICRALDYIHQKNLVHLDLKPSNLLIHEDSRLLLSDFGLVRPVTQGKAVGGVSLGAGTPLYMAPEHVRGQPEKRSDVYSLGMILYQLLLHQVALKGSIPIQVARPDLPPAAVPVLKKALAPLAEDRYLTAGALLIAFKSTFLPPTLRAANPPVGFSGPTIPQYLLQQPVPALSPEQATPVRTPSSATGTTHVTYRGHNSDVRFLAWSPDGTYIASASSDNSLQVWNPTTGASSFKKYPLSRIEGVAWSPDGRAIAAGDNTRIVVWRIDSGKKLSAYRHKNYLLGGVAWSPDGERIASTSFTGRYPKMAFCVYTWNAPSRSKLKNILRGRKRRIYKEETTNANNFTDASVAWSPDSKRIVAASLHTSQVHVWDAATRKTLLTYHNHTGPVTTVAWSPDGRYIASASHDRTAHIWDAATGATLLIYRGHTDKVITLAWSPDGQYIASGSEDKTIQIWEATAGKALITYRGHMEGRSLVTVITKGFFHMRALAWSPDGTRIVSSSNDGKVLVWQAF